MSHRIAGFDPDQNLPDSLWRPRNWEAEPDPPRPADAVWLLLILSLVVLYNPLLNLLLPDAVHVVTNLALTALIGGLAWKAGATLDNLGLRADMLGRGLVVGAVFVIAIAAGVVVVTALPATREFFADDRFIGVGAGEMLYEAAVRIPFGTVLAEEFVFRGVILALLLRRSKVWIAATAAALLFGLWHVIPALDAIETNPAGDLVTGVWGVLGSVAGTVLFTALVGLGFTWLRFRGNSLITPVLAHIATNSFGYVAGWLVVTRAWA